MLDSEVCRAGPAFGGIPMHPLMRLGRLCTSTASQELPHSSQLQPVLVSRTEVASAELSIRMTVVVYILSGPSGPPYVCRYYAQLRISRQCLINAAGSRGRCNTIQSVDPTILLPREPICPGVLDQDPSQNGVPFEPRLANDCWLIEAPTSGLRPRVASTH